MLIAYLDRNTRYIRVLTPDGLSDRQVSGPDQLFLFGLDWSPDSKWLVAREGLFERPIWLFNVQTGEGLPLAFAKWYGPSWKP